MIQNTNARVWELSSKLSHVTLFFFSITALTASFPLQMNVQIVGMRNFSKLGTLPSQMSILCLLIEISIYVAAPCCQLKIPRLWFE